MKIHQIGGYGEDSNIYLVMDKVIALVDAGTGRHFDMVTKNLQKFGISPSDIELIINTHCHYDHVGGDRDFLNAADCGVAIHELDAEPLRKGDGVITCAALFGEELEPLEPTRLLRDGDRIELGELVLEVLHTPGHTRGGICLYDRERQILFSGDLVFCGGIGRTDHPTGDEAVMARSIRRLTKLKVQTLLPGHGPIAYENAHEHIEAALRLLET
jgi:glyoxylase-like metal-dependent hydrolase (beta-lactamase superfamily II)